MLLTKHRRMALNTNAFASAAGKKDQNLSYATIHSLNESLH